MTNPHDCATLNADPTGPFATPTTISPTAPPTEPTPLPTATDAASDRTPAEPPAPSLDAAAKRMALDAELERARVELLLETLDTRGRDALDFHEIPVHAIRNLVRQSFETGYRDGLHTGYRQGRRDACEEAAGREAPSQPRNPDLVDLATTDPTP